jgi:hypothetical protein
MPSNVFAIGWKFDYFAKQHKASIAIGTTI